MSEKCRLCLKIIPSESVIKLYHFLHDTTETAEMVNLIAKYLDIKVKKDDVVSTTICQVCNDQLEEFHKFSEDVAAKQLTLLGNDFLEVDLKKECSQYDDNTEEKIDSTSMENNIPTAEQAMFEYPIDVKDELDSEKDTDDLCVQDMLEADLNEDDAEEYKPPDDIQSSEDDMPLIQLKARKKKTKPSSTSSNKKKRNRSQSKSKQIKEPKQKRERKPKISGQQLIATSLELKCDICQTQVTTWKELRQHFLLAHTRTPYIKCCGTVYDKQRPLVDHLQWHKDPDAFKCQLCDENLGNSRDLTTHISSVHPDNVDLLQHYECEHCFKQFRSFTIYKNHLRSHSKDRDVECHICNKRCATIYRLRSHIESVHNNVYHHICDICGKKFKSKTAFQKHYDEHQGIVEPAAQCSICHAWLKNQYSLKVHMTIHENTQFPCDICGKMFNTKKNLSRHKGYWHRLEKNLKCSYCEKIFREKRNLDEHMATHTETQLYTCPHCGKESRSKSNMYVHIKRQHPDEWWQSKQERYRIKPKDDESNEVAIEPNVIITPMGAS